MSSRFQLAETEGTAPLGAVIPKRPVPEASWVRRKAIFNGRKLRRAFSDLFLSCMECNAASPPQAQPRRLDERPDPFSAGLRSEPAVCPRALPGGKFCTKQLDA